MQRLPERKNVRFMDVVPVFRFNKTELKHRTSAPIILFVFNFFGIQSFHLGGKERFVVMGVLIMDIVLKDMSALLARVKTLP